MGKTRVIILIVVSHFLVFILSLHIYYLYTHISFFDLVVCVVFGVTGASVQVLPNV